MSAKRGLGGGSILGDHLGMAAPTLLRRSSEKAPEGEGAELRQQAPVLAVVEQHSLAEAGEPSDDTSASAAAPPNNVEHVDASTEVPMPAAVAGPRRPAPRAVPSAKPRDEISASNLSRQGTRQSPYSRKRDGVHTLKVAFTAPHSLKRQIERFCFDRDLKVSEWMVEVLQRELDANSTGKRQR